jgi:hypothetical protein
MLEIVIYLRELDSLLYGEERILARHKDNFELLELWVQFKC